MSAVLGTLLLIPTGCALPAGSPSLKAHNTSGEASPSLGEDPTQSARPRVSGDQAKPDDGTVDPVITLAALSVKGRAPMTGYSRASFGDSWVDTDANGCDTRDDVLTRDLVHRLYEARTSCVVVAGDLADPYTSTTIHFIRGDGDLVDIDHVVALGNAWATGAYGWDARKLLQFANDPSNLLAVDAFANRQKGDGDAAAWLPHNKTFRCDYVAQQISVKAKYGLWVTQPEREAMLRVLARCSDQQLPGPGSAPTPATYRGPPATASERDSGGDAGSAHFANCDAARAAGAAPVHRGDPGYSSRLDRDGDGTGCE